MRRCPDSKTARRLGCLDLKEDGQCTRQDWGSPAYLQTKTPDKFLKSEVYCERVGYTVREA